MEGKKEADHMLPSLPLLRGRGIFLGGAKILSKNSHVRLLPAPARVRPRRRRSLVSGRRRVRWRAGRQTETRAGRAEGRLSGMEELPLPSIRAAGLDTPTSSACIKWEPLTRAEVCKVQPETRGDVRARARARAPGGSG